MQTKIAIVVLILLLFSGYMSLRSNLKCREKGGLYIQGKCVKVDVIP